MSKPEIALLVSTYQRPAHLERSLASIALQTDVDDKMEVIVTDDGSVDETASIVRRFAEKAPFEVKFTTHPHVAFQLSRCRNEGVAASDAPYLLFLDGDCILPPDHVRTHLERRRPNTVMAGACLRLDKEESDRITVESVASGEFTKMGSNKEKRWLAKLRRQGWFYETTRHPTKPRLFGNNIGIWRSDYEKVNGYDERFEGWGCEDDDLRLRLRQAGIRIRSILGHTFTYHLWHPNESTNPTHWRQGPNVAYLRRAARLTRCRNGLVKRGIDDVRVSVEGATGDATPLNGLLPPEVRPNGKDKDPEVEVLVLPGDGRFGRTADARLLVVLDHCNEARRLAREAHLVLSDVPVAKLPDGQQLPLERLDWVLREFL